MSELPNKKELEKAAEKYSREEPSDAYKELEWGFIAGAHYQHQISYAQGIKDAVDILRDEKIAPRMTSLDNPGYYLCSDDVANFLQTHFAKELRPIDTLNDEQRSGE